MFQSAESSRNELIEMISIINPSPIKDELEILLDHFDSNKLWAVSTGAGIMLARLVMPAEVYDYVQESEDVFSIWHNDLLKYIPINKVPNIYQAFEQKITIGSTNHNGCIAININGFNSKARYWSIIRHEQVHAEQIRSGRLVLNPVTGEATWEGKVYQNIAPEHNLEAYLSLPWEVEAYGIADPRKHLF